MGGGSQPQAAPVVQSTSSQPWQGVAPYLSGGNIGPQYNFSGEQTSPDVFRQPGIFQLALEQYKSPQPEYFPGQTLAGFNPLQTQAQQSVADRAQAPNPLLTGAYGTAAGYAAGDFNNPAIQGALKANRDAIQPSVDARFGAAGRSFSPGHAAALGKAITNANAPYLLGGQQAAIQAAPALSQAQYQDAAQLAGVGQQQQGQSQAQINADIERYNAGQTKDQRKLGQLAGFIGSSSPTSSLTTGQQFLPGGPSTLSNVFQGVNAGANLAAGGAQAYKAYNTPATTGGGSK